MISETLEVTTSTVTSWLAGQSIPRPSYAGLISDITNGEVTIADFHSHYQEVHSEAVE